MITIYGDVNSGNCYKIQLLASILELDYQWVPINILKGETRTASYVSMNPNGKIPLLALDDGRFIAESNAILNYLAEGTELLPTDRFQRAKVLEWQFFEQYSHEPYIAVARFIAKYLGLPEERRQEYEAKQAGGYKALSVMESQLSRQDYIATDAITIADISLYGYTHVADEGGFDLSNYPAVRAWLNRIQAHPRYLGMG